MTKRTARQPALINIAIEWGSSSFKKDSIATFEKKRDTAWIPERALMYINMCRRCNKKIK